METTTALDRSAECGVGENRFSKSNSVFPTGPQIETRNVESLARRGESVRNSAHGASGPTSKGFRVLRATHLGMCFGVRDAIALAHDAARQQPVTILGDLVHNGTVLDDLRARGVRFAETPGEAQTNTVMITAHGTSDRARLQLRERGFNVLESTCPLVHFAHRALRTLVQDGFHPVVIGKRDHVEVRGLTGDFDACDVVLTEEDVTRLQPRARFGVVSQTTQPIEHVRRLVAIMRRQFPESEIRFRDTVCQPTKQRQSAAVELAQQCDVVIVIGGAHSNNTRELVTTCARYCRRVHHVQHADDLRAEWFHESSTIGLTAGTSTPDSVIDEVERALAAFRGIQQAADMEAPR
jgi:4-hydroxy-3-methylbut-2-en-1-yl diphosphate reductase